MALIPHGPLAALPNAQQNALQDAHRCAIRQSHERCAALGLSRVERPEHAPLTGPALNRMRERKRRLHSHATPVMQMLYEQIAGSESMVVLCDDTGTILHSVGDDDFLHRASKVALAPGVNWAEQRKGTNAIGTALIDERPTLVHADEHFMQANQFLTCSAVPILDPRGSMLGVLDVTGDHRSYHAHTMALVRLSARMIENHWLADDYRNLMRLHFHRRPEFIGTLMEGILAVTPEGRIVGANRGALEHLALSGASLRMQCLDDLFGVSVGAVVDRFRSPLASPLAVVDAQGQHFHLQARFSWPSWAVGSAVPELASLLPASTAPAGSQLAALATGDVAFDAVLAQLRQALDGQVTVFIQGETGTGKGLLARAWHDDSPRQAQAFVAVHCAAALESDAETDLEQALFAAGGALQRAAAGTLFLDEVGALSPRLQARLLHALHGAAPAALVCAGQASLRASGMREDLIHRLAGLSLQLPALRARSDLPLLAQQLLAQAGRSGLTLGEDTRALLQAAPWPGNVRQLANVLRSAAALAGADGVIRPAHLPEELRVPHAAAAASLAPARTLGAVEIDAIRLAVQACGGNVSQAARQLGVSRNTIYRKLRD